MKITAKTALSLFRQMLRIRIAEERIAELYPHGEMRTPTHFSIGQEAVSVGVCHALRKDDAVFASHRCHAAYLAKGGSLKGMTAELFGRAAGSCGGRSGSAHLSSPENNMYAAPILGGMIPVAVGRGLSFLMDKANGIAVAFLGDAAVEEGVFSESINFSIVKHLPVFFVCENNLFSTHTRINKRQPAIPIHKRVKGFGLKSICADGNNVLEVYGTAKNCISEIRRGLGPVFMECFTYRYREHVGPDFDFNNPYRTRREVESWIRRCPIKRLEKKLLKDKKLTYGAFKKMKAEIKKEIEEAVKYARKAPWPKKEDLLKHVV